MNDLEQDAPELTDADLKTKIEFLRVATMIGQKN
jgi:hypothetical protein